MLKLREGIELPIIPEDFVIVPGDRRPIIDYVLARNETSAARRPYAGATGRSSARMRRRRLMQIERAS